MGIHQRVGARRGASGRGHPLSPRQGAEATGCVPHTTSPEPQGPRFTQERGQNGLGTPTLALTSLLS